MCVSKITRQNLCNHRHQRVQPLSVLKIKMMKPSSRPYFFCQYYIVCESNNAGKVRGQSWNESLKTRCIPEELCGLYEWYKAKIVWCAFFAAAMLTMVAAATIVRSPPWRCGYHLMLTNVWSCFKIKKKTWSLHSMLLSSSRTLRYKR